MSSPVEISKESIKLSYRRFLSDSAAGYVVLLYLILSYKTNIELAIPWHVAPASGHVKLIIGFLLILLATPLGIILNALSWFLLGGIVIPLERALIWSNFWPVRATHEVYGWSVVSAALGLRKEEWLWQVRVITEALLKWDSRTASEIEALSGSRVMLRSLGFVGLIIGLVEVSHGSLELGAFMLVAAIVLVVLSALADVYYHCNIMAVAYITCAVRGESVQGIELLKIASHIRESGSQPEKSDATEH